MVDSRAMSESLRLSENGVTRPGRWLFARPLVLLALALILSTVVFELSRWSRLPASTLLRDEVAAPEHYGAIELSRPLVAEFLSDHPLPGLSLCVGIEGAPAWCIASGYSDLESRAKLTPDSAVRIGSVSKTLTAAILARLQERGLVNLDGPAGSVIDPLPKHLQELTARQLASHTAGVRHYRWRFGWPPHEIWWRTHYDSVTDSLQLFVNDPLLFPPGTAFSYSSYGYTLLGALLERASGEKFASLLQREIVQPLGLRATSLDMASVGEPDNIRYYETFGRAARSTLTIDTSRSWPGAGILSSPEDLVIFATALSSGHLVSDATLETLLTPQLLPDGTRNEQNYALGWRITQTRKFLGGVDSYRVAHHGGVSSGASAFLLLFPDQNVAVAVATNSRTGSALLAGLAFAVAEPFMAAVTCGS